ncbi:beta-lactamase-like protein [Hyaloraphidium curvatum]|nr:beta-lactamase-like protein [Hyaloraphidium curvatum]
MSPVAVDSSCQRPNPVTEVKAIFEPVTATCQYVVTDPATKASVIIDPVLDYDPVSGKVTTKSADEVLAYVAEKGLKVERIIETHMHADHLTSAQYLKTMLGRQGTHGLDGKSAPVTCIGERITVVQETFAKIFRIPESEMARDGSQFDVLWKDGEMFKLGNLDCKVFFTPGHTPACSTVQIGPDAAFCGDTIFLPDVGSARCDFPKGSAETLYKSIKEGLFGLPDSVRIYVGHDYPPVDADSKKPARDPAFCSTVGAQKTENKQINAETPLDAFVEWRHGRDKTLGKPRLLYQSLQVNMRGGRFPTRKMEGEDGELIALIMPVEMPAGFGAAF